MGLRGEEVWGEGGLSGAGKCLLGDETCLQETGINFLYRRVSLSCVLGSQGKAGKVPCISGFIMCN